MPPPLGFITPIERTAAQESAHNAAMAQISNVKFALPVKQLAKGQSVRLFDLFKNPDVVADVGFPLTRSHQLTGSCVNSGFWVALCATMASQRVASDKPTKAFMPFTLHNYAASRHYMGDDGQGEGSLGSTIARSYREDGVRDWPVDRTDIMPEYSYSLEDGVKISAAQEMQWSSYRYKGVSEILGVSKPHTGVTAECKGAEDIQAMVQNGYGVTFACNNYIGNASIKGSGADACVVGYWDGRGGHQQSILAIWNHPTLGMLYWAQNNWDAGTYPIDPAGGLVCGCWVTEKKVEEAMRLDSEVFGLSHLQWFEAQPKIVDYAF